MTHTTETYSTTCAKTPTLWKTGDARCASGFLISGHDGMTVAIAKTAHNAAFIVRACNSHAALVAALEALNNAVVKLYNSGAISDRDFPLFRVEQADAALRDARNP